MLLRYTSRTLTYHWWEFKVVQLLWKTSWPFLIKLNMNLRYDQAILILMTKQLQAKYISGKRFTQKKWKHISTKRLMQECLYQRLFIVVKNWKHPKDPSTKAYINKLYIHLMHTKWILNMLLSNKRNKLIVNSTMWKWKKVYQTQQCIDR